MLSYSLRFSLIRIFDAIVLRIEVYQLLTFSYDSSDVIIRGTAVSKKDFFFHLLIALLLSWFVRYKIILTVALYVYHKNIEDQVIVFILDICTGKICLGTFLICLEIDMDLIDSSYLFYFLQVSLSEVTQIYSYNFVLLFFASYPIV